MKSIKTKLAILFGVLAGSVAAFALQAGPYLLNGKVTASNEKTVTLEVGEQIAEVPRSIIPQKYKTGTIEKGTVVSLALTEEQSRQVKVTKK